MKKQAVIFFLLLSIFQMNAQKIYKSEILFEDGECWWGGAVALGSQMPYLKPINEFDLSLQNGNNQVVPLFLSNKGRYIWSDQAFRFEVKSNTLLLQSKYEQLTVKQTGKTLHDAYIAACHNHFPPTGLLPEELLSIIHGLN